MREHVTQDMMSELIQDRVRIYCQDRFSQSKADVDGGAKVMGKLVGSGRYCSRVVGVKAKQVALVVGGVMTIAQATTDLQK